MLEARSEFLAQLQAREQADRANGSYGRHLLTEMGTVLLQVPRTRSWSAAGLLQAYRRRSVSVDRAVLGCFLLGLSTRKVACALLPMLGERISAATVSNISKGLDTAVAAFHRRRIRQSYRVLVFDGVVLARKTGAGAVRRPVLVALGIRHDGRKEIIDFRQAQGESTQAWEAFLNDLYRRGLGGEGLELICSDGGTGLRAALPLVYPHVPVQLCWAHSIHLRKPECGNWYPAGPDTQLLTLPLTSADRVLDFGGPEYRRSNSRVRRPHRHGGAYAAASQVRSVFPQIRLVCRHRPVPGDLRHGSRAVGGKRSAATGRDVPGEGSRSSGRGIRLRPALRDRKGCGGPRRR
jgi:hypothetical protein